MISIQSNRAKYDREPLHLPMARSISVCSTQFSTFKRAFLAKYSTQLPSSRTRLVHPWVSTAYQKCVCCANATAPEWHLVGQHGPEAKEALDSWLQATMALTLTSMPLLTGALIRQLLLWMMKPSPLQTFQAMCLTAVSGCATTVGSRMSNASARR